MTNTATTSSVEVAIERRGRGEHAIVRTDIGWVMAWASSAQEAEEVAETCRNLLKGRRAV